MRPTRLLGLLTPIAIMIGVVVLLLLPNLIMHASPDGLSGPVASGIDQHAESESAVAGMVPPTVR
jgi:hypothetical protein